MKSFSRVIALWFFLVCSTIPLHAAPIPVGTTPTSIVSADFNNSGFDSFAVADSGLLAFSQLEIFINDTHGNFTQSQMFTLGMNTLATAAVVNPDVHVAPFPMLAVALNKQQEILLFLNNGSGVFTQSVQTLPTGASVSGSPLSIASGNLKGNGKQDLVVPNSGTQTLSLFYGNNGTYTVGPEIPIASNLSPTNVAVGDLNGDGFDDLAVTLGSVSPGIVRVYLNDKTGNFSAFTDYNIGILPLAVAIADLRNNGLNDIVATNSNNNYVSVLLNNGNGTFAPAVNYPTVGNAPIGLTIADFSGTGRQDLAVVTEASSQVNLFLNNGDGTFQSPIVQTTDSAPISITSGHFFDDTISYLVAAFGAGTVNAPQTNLTQTVVIQSSAVSNLGQSVTFTATVSLFPSSSQDPTGTVTFTIDGNPGPSLPLVNGSASFSTSTLSAGTHTITASYSSNAGLEPSVDPLLIKSIKFCPPLR